jgi:hypothetical protein
MANKVLSTNIQIRDLVSMTSRYSDSTAVYYGDQHKITFKTYKKRKLPDSTADKYMEITPGYEFRPDKVSHLAYGTVDFWWLIMEANNIKDIMDFKSGMTVRVPTTMFSL